MGPVVLSYQWDIHVEIYNSQERAGPGEIYFRIICNQHSILVKVEEIEEEEAREKKGN